MAKGQKKKKGKGGKTGSPGSDPRVGSGDRPARSGVQTRSGRKVRPPVASDFLKDTEYCPSSSEVSMDQGGESSEVDVETVPGRADPVPVASSPLSSGAPLDFDPPLYSPVSSPQGNSGLGQDPPASPASDHLELTAPPELYAWGSSAAPPAEHVGGSEVDNSSLPPQQHRLVYEPAASTSRSAEAAQVTGTLDGYGDPVRQDASFSLTPEPTDKLLHVMTESGIGADLINPCSPPNDHDTTTGRMDLSTPPLASPHFGNEANTTIMDALPTLEETNRLLALSPDPKPKSSSPPREASSPIVGNSGFRSPLPPQKPEGPPHPGGGHQPAHGVGPTAPEGGDGPPVIQSQEWVIRGGEYVLQAVTTFTPATNPTPESLALTDYQASLTVQSKAKETLRRHNLGQAPLSPSSLSNIQRQLAEAASESENFRTQIEAQKESRRLAGNKRERDVSTGSSAGSSRRQEINQRHRLNARQRRRELKSSNPTGIKVGKSVMEAASSVCRPQKPLAPPPSPAEVEAVTKAIQKPPPNFTGSAGSLAVPASSRSSAASSPQRGPGSDWKTPLSRNQRRKIQASKTSAASSHKSSSDKQQSANPSSIKSPIPPSTPPTSHAQGNQGLQGLNIAKKDHSTSTAQPGSLAERWAKSKFYKQDQAGRISETLFPSGSPACQQAWADCGITSLARDIVANLMLLSRFAGLWEERNLKHTLSVEGFRKQSLELHLANFKVKGSNPKGPTQTAPAKAAAAPGAPKSKPPPPPKTKPPPATVTSTMPPPSKATRYSYVAGRSGAGSPQEGAPASGDLGTTPSSGPSHLARSGIEGQSSSRRGPPSAYFLRIYEGHQNSRGPLRDLKEWTAIQTAIFLADEAAGRFCPAAAQVGWASGDRHGWARCDSQAALDSFKCRIAEVALEGGSRRFKAWTDAEIAASRVTVECRTYGEAQMALAVGIPKVQARVINCPDNKLKDLVTPGKCWFSQGSAGPGGYSDMAAFNLEVNQEGWLRICAMGGRVGGSTAEWTVHYRSAQLREGMAFPTINSPIPTPHSDTTSQKPPTPVVVDLDAESQEPEMEVDKTNSPSPSSRTTSIPSDSTISSLSSSANPNSSSIPPPPKVVETPKSS